MKVKHFRFLKVISSRLWIKLLTFNLILVFLPIAGLFYFEVYEEKLLEIQEQSMVQQGRLVAAALASSMDLPLDSEKILENLQRRTNARIRILNSSGRMLADTSIYSLSDMPEEEDISQSSYTEDPTDSFLYRIGRVFYQLYNQISGRRSSSGLPPSYYSGKEFLLGPEVKKALSGQYGAAWRISPGQRSVTLYSAIPVRNNNIVTGVVLVSQSTLGVLNDLYDIRIGVFKVILLSIFAAAILSYFLSRNIAKPLSDLKKAALEILDPKGRVGKNLSESRELPSISRMDEIGDLSRALAELSRRLQERIDSIQLLSSDISHELKNPLASIRAAAEILPETEKITDQKRFLDIIQVEVTRLERLISSLREVTTIDAGLDSETREPVGLAKYVQQFVDDFKLRFPGQNISINHSGEKDRVYVNTDRLDQVLENLLENACEFSGYDGPVMVFIDGDNHIVSLEIRDQGPGIPQDNLDRIFNRFFSHRPAGNQAENNHMGLGLAIVKAIVEAYGGTISAGNSDSGGAWFKILLPQDSRVS